MMGSMCGPGNNGMMGMSNHGGGGPMGPGMLMNSNNSNQSMIGGPGSMINQHGIYLRLFSFKCILTKVNMIFKF